MVSAPLGKVSFGSWGMKKKIAVFANGWSNEALSNAVKGIKKYAAQEDFDVFIFLSFANATSQTETVQGELNVYALCNMTDYDGIIVFSNMMNSDKTVLSLCKSARDQGVPLVSIGMELEGFPCVGVDGNTGMRDLVTHLVEKHKVRDVVFVAGTPNHAESNARLEIVRNVLKEHGLTLKDENVINGFWSNRRTVAALHEILDRRGGKLPDAFIFANDIMALAAATELGNMGYQLPKDVIVTGFDHIKDGQIFFPALTTVQQNYDEVGYQCCKILFDIIQKGKFKPRYLVSTSMHLGESCGCGDATECWKIRTEFCKHYYQKTTDANIMGQRERSLRQKISEANSYADLKVSLREHFQENHRFEGNNLHLVVNAEYFQNVMVDEKEIWEKRARKKLEVVVSLKDGAIQEVERMERRQLVPGYEKKDGVQHVYYFLPLHFMQYNYGYVVFADEPYVFTEDLLYAYMERLQQALKLLRTNLRLDALNKNLTRLYDRDPMTDLFNRFGYENKAIPLYQDSIRKRESMMVMFVDINFMKRINDQHGHIHGDAAIRTVAEAIKENIDANWIAVRFGGDEFLIIAPDCDETEAEDVKDSILEYLEEKNNDGSRPYHISASCGYVITDPESGYPLQEYIREADRLMYEIKAEVHAKDEEEQKKLKKQKA